MRFSGPLSLYLDLLRIFAALAVFIGHAGGYLLPGLPRLITSHADEGVAVFFVLSGFVIGMVTDGKERSLSTYLGARALRMYSVVPVALLATYLFDNVGYELDPNTYRALPWLDRTSYYDNFGATLISLLRALTFTNEFWMSSSSFGSNHAYWSLGFEVPYYIAFGVLFFTTGALRICGIGFWLICVGPQIALFFLLWLAGTACYYAVRRPPNVSRWIAWGMALAVVPAYGFVKLGFRDYKLPIYDPVAILPSLQSFGYYMAIGVAITVNIAGMAVLLRHRMTVYPWLANSIRWIAGGTFTLYLVHQPMMVLGRSVMQRYGSDRVAAFGITVFVFAACYALAELGERRKRTLQQLIRSVRTG